MNASSYFRKELLQARRDWPGLLLTVLAPFPVLWILGELEIPTAARAPSGFPTMDPPAFAVLLTLWLAGSTAAANAILRERTAGTLQRLSLTPFSAPLLVVAKAVLFLPAAFAQALVTYVGCDLFLDGAFADRPVEVMLTFGLLAAAAFTLGLVLSAACGSITQVASATTVATMASILWSGFFEPTADLGWMRPLAEALPFTVAYDAVRAASADTFDYAGWAKLLAALAVSLGLAGLFTRLRSRQVSA